MSPPCPEAPAIRVSGLRHVLGGRPVLDIPDLSLSPGKIHVILGPNGAGKSTLVGILALLDAPTQGVIRYEGAAISVRDRKALAWRRRTALVAQAPFMFDTTVLGNVLYGLRQRGVARPESRRRASTLLPKLGLGGFEGRYARELSGGESKQVAIARALVLEPRILFLDEPTANVDRQYVGMVERTVRDLQAETGQTVVLTTHDLAQAERLGDELHSLSGGHIVPTVPDNVFRGRVVVEGRERWVALRSGLRIHAQHAPADGQEVTVGIDPNDILVSLEPLASSARNSLPGLVAEITRSSDGVRLKVHAGETFWVSVTDGSGETLALRPGGRVHLTFKSSSVRVL